MENSHWNLFLFLQNEMNQFNFSVRNALLAALNTRPIKMTIPDQAFPIQTYVDWNDIAIAHLANSLLIDQCDSDECIRIQIRLLE